MFRLAHLSENLGYGLSKLKTWESVTGNAMKIEPSLSSVKVIFYFRSTEESHGVAKNGAKNERAIPERQRVIIEIILDNLTISLNAIANILGIGTTTLDREISKMSELTRRIGPKKGGHWEIIDYPIHGDQN